MENPMSAEDLARLFHETYERLAPDHGYETRKESAKPWEDVPEKNKGLMIAVCQEIMLAYSKSVYRPMKRSRKAATPSSFLHPNPTGDDVLDAIRLAQLRADEESKSVRSRERSLTITKIDEAELWRRRALELDAASKPEVQK